MCNFVCLISYLYKTTSIIYNDDVTEISPFTIMRIRKCPSGILSSLNSKKMDLLSNVYATWTESFKYLKLFVYSNIKDNFSKRQK